MSALPADLQGKGLLDQRLVVLGTEFGLKPRINDNDGRDQHEAFRCLLAGWDTHSDNFEGAPPQAAILEQVTSAQLADLQAKGLLD